MVQIHQAELFQQWNLSCAASKSNSDKMVRWSRTCTFTSRSSLERCRGESEKLDSQSTLEWKKGEQTVREREGEGGREPHSYTWVNIKLDCSELCHCLSMRSNNRCGMANPNILSAIEFVWGKKGLEKKEKYQQLS